jgi:hypothetical protein
LASVLLNQLEIIIIELLDFGYPVLLVSAVLLGSRLGLFVRLLDIFIRDNKIDELYTA